MFRTVTDAYHHRRRPHADRTSGRGASPTSVPTTSRPAMRGLVDRAGSPRRRIDDVILGCANQAGEDNRNVARMAAAARRSPGRDPGQTVNRLCGSGLQAVVSAASGDQGGRGRAVHRRRGREHDAGALHHAEAGTPWDRTPPLSPTPPSGWRFTNPDAGDWTISLGQTAERVAQTYGSRREGAGRVRGREPAARPGRDRGRAFEAKSCRSRPAKKANRHGTRGRASAGRRHAGGLGQAAPAFQRDGTVTAGNSSGINDGAAVLAVARATTVKGWARKPLARVVGSAVAGVDPSCMGLGPSRDAQGAGARRPHHRGST